MKKILVLVFSLFLFSSVSEAETKSKKEAEPKKETYAVATFAGGCFWCIQPPFDKFKDKGVIETSVGYSGGDIKNPTYEQVSTGTTGHAESVQIKYDPSKITYEKLLDIYWSNIDPTDDGGQYVDRGSQYRPVIFYHTEEQKRIATESRKKLEDSKQYKKPIVVMIEPYKFFVVAEDYHQGFYQKNPVRYNIYKAGSGRTSH